MGGNDYIPRKDVEFAVWFKNFIAYLAKMYVVPDTVMVQLNTLGNDFSTKLDVSENPATRTKLTIEAKNEARKALEDVVRQVVREYLTNNHLVTDVDRDGLGIPIHKSGRTPARVEKNAPAFEVSVKRIRTIEVHYFGAEVKESRAKPEGQHGAELAWILSETPIVDTKDFTHSTFDTRSPFVLEFEGHDRGKTIYFALRWENTRGEKGPWSEITSAIIP